MQTLLSPKTQSFASDLGGTGGTVTVRSANAKPGPPSVPMCNARSG